MTTAAWVESPLQALNVLEWAHATGEPCNVVLRSGVPSLDPLRARLLPLVTNSIPHVEMVTAADPFRAGLRSATRWVVGDAFSGHFRLLTVLSTTREAVVVDDGSATLHLARVLRHGEAFGRMGQHESTVARALGLATRARLVRAASAGRLELFTAYDVAEVRGLVDLGVTVTMNRYQWVRSVTPLEPHAVGQHVVIGSALAADGYIDADAYERWATTAGGPGATYLPHRRESAEVLYRLTDAGLNVVRTELPAELVLATSPGLRSVISLPSSTAATLAHVLPSAVLHRIEPVPPHWWTDAADASMRRALSDTVPRS